MAAATAEAAAASAPAAPLSALRTLPNVALLPRSLSSRHAMGDDDDDDDGGDDDVGRSGEHHSRRGRMLEPCNHVFVQTCVRWFVVARRI